MKKIERIFNIISIGGMETFQAELSPDLETYKNMPAPSWLVKRLGRDESGNWFLSIVQSRHLFSQTLLPTALLWRQVSAGAIDPRTSRLLAEKEKIDELNKESDFVRLMAFDNKGDVPEHYKAIFICRGIGGIDDISRQPIYKERHEVDIYCDQNFPSEPPRLRWLTDIWHPNIHSRTKDVCINSKEWLGGMSIVDLCRQLFEMVQYKNYHAIHVPPYPLDGEAARWVLEYAEPSGIVNKRRGVFVDNKPFTRPDSLLSIRLNNSSDMSKNRIKILSSYKTSSPRIKLLEDTPSKEEKDGSKKIRILDNS